MNRLETIKQAIKSTKQEYIYSVPIGNPVNGETQIHRKPNFKDGLLKVTNYNSLAQLWGDSVKKFQNNRCLQNSTYSKVHQQAFKVGSWIANQGHKVFFLYAKNCYNWTVADIASWNYGFTNVPLYDTLGYQAFDHILRITQGTLIFATNDLAPNLEKYLGKNRYNVKHICFLDRIQIKTKKVFESMGFKVNNFDDLLNYNRHVNPPNLNLDTEIYYGFTSGTTGIPKGVVYTHRMAIAQLLAMNGHYDILSTDVHMSFLPIAHTFQRFVIWVCLERGANIWYAKHLITQIFKDFAQIRPTTLPMVPRLLNKFYPVFKAIHAKQGNHNKMKAMFGGRVRIIVTGSAPVSPQILKFFQSGLQCDLRQGYGQTETTAASFVTYKGDTNYGHVGGPNGATQFKLVSVPQMNYLTSENPPKGEICMRGQSVFTKYFKDPKNTQQTVDADGWNHSGDIGTILPNGALKIIDRKKNIFKLQQGQYIAPQKIQNIYARCPYVAESFLYGDSLKDYNIAIIHPNLDYLPTVAKKMGIQEKDNAKLCENPQITAFILEQITKQGKNDGLLGFELAKKIKLTPHPFQILGIVTSTMKLQRHIAKQLFKKQIQEMYR